MKVFFDTNIIPEYLHERKYARSVGRIMQCVEEEKIEGYLSVGSFYTLTYLIDAHLKKDFGVLNPERLHLLRGILENVLGLYRIIDITSKELLQGVRDKYFTDLEDSYQYQSALFAGCDIFLTINVRDFQNIEQSPIRILSPEQFEVEFL